MEKIKDDISHYYSNKLKIHGLTPQGVDWNSKFSQELRFFQLLKVCDCKEDFSINDLGCGFGALNFYLETNGYKYTYRGYDLSINMINAAENIFKDYSNCEFSCGDELYNADYTVASGIFNVKMDYKQVEWEEYVFTTLNMMNMVSEKGFAFNILTKYSDQHYMKDNLYYADPCFYFDYCKLNFSKNVALLHDYDLYEFTILVKKA